MEGGGAVDDSNDNNGNNFLRIHFSSKIRNLFFFLDLKNKNIHNLPCLRYYFFSFHIFNKIFLVVV